MPSRSLSPSFASRKQKTFMTRPLFTLTMLVSLAGCSTGATIEFRAASLSAVSDGTNLVAPGSDLPVFVQPQIVIANRDIESARLGQTASGERAVNLALTDRGAEKLGSYMAAHLVQPIAVVVNGELFSAPIVKSQLTKSAMIIGGPSGISETQATMLLRSLNK